jgi:hypothetical protein
VPDEIDVLYQTYGLAQLFRRDYERPFPCMLADERYCYPVTVSDFASRYLIRCRALAKYPPDCMLSAQVAIAHVFEVFLILPAFGCGQPHSVGHYIDLVPALLSTGLRSARRIGIAQNAGEPALDRRQHEAGGNERRQAEDRDYPGRGQMRCPVA